MRAHVESAKERWEEWDNDDVVEDDYHESSNGSTELLDLPSWIDKRCGRSSEFIGLGYTTTISSFAKSRHYYWGARSALGIDTVENRFSARQRREASRTKRELTAVEDTEDLYLAFERFKFREARAALMEYSCVGARPSEGGVEKIRASLPKSKVFDEDSFSIIDSGTTVSIVKNGEGLNSFDEQSQIKIMGFNGSVTRSQGRGSVFGYARVAGGRGVAPLRLPAVHHVSGAPHDLLSVSSMISQGYEFYFTKSRSYIITPDKDELDLIQKHGLFWLKWRRAVDPGTRAAHQLEKMYEQQPRGGNQGQSSESVRGTETEPKTPRQDTDKLRGSGSSATGLSPTDDASFLSLIDLPDSNGPSRVVPSACSEKRCELCNMGRVRGNSIPLMLLHRRLGHWNENMIQKMVKHRAVDYTLTDTARCVCDVCRVAKATRRTVPREREELAEQDKPFQRVWTDLKGKVSKDFFGNQYMVTFTCEVTRWTCVYFAKTKSDVKKSYREFLQWVALRGHKVELLNSDGGGEYTASENARVISEFEKISLEHGVTQNFTSAHTPEMNGVSERLNRTIVEHTRALLIEAGLSREFWSLAAKHVVYLRNRLWHTKLTSSVVVGASPFQKVYGKAPKLANLRVWGSDSWKFDHMYRSSSFARKAKKMIFVGVSPNRKGWVLFDPATRKTSTTYHCTFDEDMGRRRCALRDFDLRQRKAGSASTDDEERLANLERSLYDDSPTIEYDEARAHEDEQPLMQRSEEAHRAPPKALQRDSGVREDGSVQQSPVRDRQGVTSDQVDAKGAPGQILTPPPHGEQEVAAAPTVEATSQQLNRARGVQEERKQPRGGQAQDVSQHPPPSEPHRRIGGRREGRSTDVHVIPERRAAIGAPQDLDDEELDFLKTALELNLPMVMQQRNPKMSNTSSRARYERYKRATTLREAKRLGAEWKDIIWDYSRGWIDFSPTAASNANLAELIERWENRPINSSPAAYVNSEGIVNTSNPVSFMTFEESIQQDYAVMAFEHIETLPHRAQRLLQKAIGNQTLEQFAHSCAARIMVPEPLSVKEAMASEHAAEWRAAMQEEINTLTKFGCFEQVSKSDAMKHGKLVKAKWVFKVKYESDGSVQRFKCRLVAKGFTQVEGTDFYETFSPVFGYTSLRAIMANAAARDFQLTQWDLKSSFIQQDLDVDHMYMECPEGYEKTTADGKPAALHCLKSIYGLKQSSRLLHERLAKYLEKLGFRQLVSDRCVFVKGTGEDQVIICTWVDDIIMSSARGNTKAREDFDRDIRKEFEMSPWTSGECDWILNMTVKRDYDKGILHLSQPMAIEKLATKFGLTGKEGRAPHVPMSPDLKLDKPAECDIVPYSTWDYRSAVGGLLYLSITSRPDIAQAVGVLSRFMSCPGEGHVAAAKQVIRYVYGTKDHGITYRRGKGNTPHQTEGLELHGYMHSRKSEMAREDVQGDSHLLGSYCDADYAGDVGTRKSTSGYGMLMSGGLICWTSKLQPTVALSTAEAETMAGVEAVKQITYLRLFLQELGHEQKGPSVVYEDNNAAISIAHGKEQSKRSKHYQIKVHFMNEAYKNGVFAFEKVPTKEMLADAFTKSLPRDDFCKYRDWMGVKTLSDSEDA